MFLCIFTIFSYFLSKKEQRKTKNNHYISKKLLKNIMIIAKIQTLVLLLVYFSIFSGSNSCTFAKKSNKILCISIIQLFCYL